MPHHGLGGLTQLEAVPDAPMDARPVAACPAPSLSSRRRVHEEN